MVGKDDIGGGKSEGLREEWVDELDSITVRHSNIQQAVIWEMGWSVEGWVGKGIYFGIWAKWQRGSNWASQHNVISIYMIISTSSCGYWLCVNNEFRLIWQSHYMLTPRLCFCTHPTLGSTLEAGAEVKSLGRGVPKSCDCLVHNGLTWGRLPLGTDRTKNDTPEMPSQSLPVCYISFRLSSKVAGQSSQIWAQLSWAENSLSVVPSAGHYGICQELDGTGRGKYHLSSLSFKPVNLSMYIVLHGLKDSYSFWAFGRQYFRLLVLQGRTQSCSITSLLPCQLNISFRGAQVAQSVKRQPLAQVMILNSGIKSLIESPIESHIRLPIEPGNLLFPLPLPLLQHSLSQIKSFKNLSFLK